MTTISVRNLVLVGLMAILLSAGSLKADLQRARDNSIEDVAKEVAKKLAATNFEDVKNVAILPLWGECDKPTKEYIGRMLQSSIIGGPYRIMERNSEAWDKLLSEMEWDVQREDTMSKDTVQRFGRIEGCDAVIYGTVRECGMYPDTKLAMTRLTLTMGIVETGEAKWSSGEVKGARADWVQPLPEDRNPALIRAVNRAAEKAAGDLKGRGTVPSGFCMFPLLGEDRDSYITGVVQGSLAKAGCGPALAPMDKWLGYLHAYSGDARSVESMRSFARDNGYKAFLWGTANECRVLDRKYKAVARMTLSLVDAETGQAVWSPGEILGASWLDWQDAVRLAVSDPIVWVLGGLVILLVFWRVLRNLIKTATRPR
jgi:hypothetical protein